MWKHEIGYHLRVRWLHLFLVVACCVSSSSSTSSLSSSSTSSSTSSTSSPIETAYPEPSNFRSIFYSALPDCSKDAYLNESSILTTDVTSSVHCATACTSQDDCLSFHVYESEPGRFSCSCFNISVADCSGLIHVNGSKYFTINKADDKDNITTTANVSQARIGRTEACQNLSYSDTCSLPWIRIFENDEFGMITYGSVDQLRSTLGLGPKVRIVYRDSHGNMTSVNALRYIFSDEDPHVAFELPRIATPQYLLYGVIDTLGARLVFVQDPHNPLVSSFSETTAMEIFIQYGDCGRDGPVYRNSNSTAVDNSVGQMDDLEREVVSFPDFVITEQGDDSQVYVFRTTSLIYVHDYDLVAAFRTMPGLKFNAMTVAEPAEFKHKLFISDGMIQTKDEGVSTSPDIDLVRRTIGWFSDICWKQVSPQLGSMTLDVMNIQYNAFISRTGRFVITYETYDTFNYTWTFEVNLISCKILTQCKAFSNAVPKVLTTNTGSAADITIDHPIHLRTFIARNDEISFMPIATTMSQTVLTTTNVKWLVDTRPWRKVSSFGVTTSTDPNDLIEALKEGSEFIMVLLTPALAEIWTIAKATYRPGDGSNALEVEFTTSLTFMPFLTDPTCGVRAMWQLSLLVRSGLPFGLSASTWSVDLQSPCSTDINYPISFIHTVELHASF